MKTIIKIIDVIFALEFSCAGNNYNAVHFVCWVKHFKQDLVIAILPTKVLSGTSRPCITGHTVGLAETF